MAAIIGCLRVPESTRWRRHPPLLNRRSAYTALPPNRIVAFSGIMADDSSAVPGSKGHSSRYTVKLERVWTAGGQQIGSGGGYVLIWVQNGETLFRGREITVQAGLAASREPGRITYMCRAAPDELQAGAYHRRIDSFRAGIFSAVQSTLRQLDPDSAALLQALLLGRREALQGSVYDLFRNSGSLHLLALSGLHLGILYLLLNLLLRFLRDRRLRRLVAAVLLLGYLYLVGWRPSLERAAVMLLVAAIGYTMDRETRPLNLLGLAAALLLLLRPHYAFDLSFQLSFMSLAAVVLLGPYLYRLWQPYLPSFVGWPLGLSLSAQIGTAPLVLHSFGALYPVGIAAAVVLIPLVTLFLAAGLLFVVVSFISLSAGTWIGALLGVMYRSIILCLDCFSRALPVYLSWRPLYWGFFAVLLVPPAYEIRLRHLLRKLGRRPMVQPC